MPFSTWYHEPTELKQPRRALAPLLIGVLAPPLLWLAGLEAAYVLAGPACRAGHSWWMLTAALSPLPMLLATAVWIAVVHRGAWHDTTEKWPVWLATSGLVSCGWFALVTLSMGIPVLWLHPCL
jgi:hypothetical protein